MRPKTSIKSGAIWLGVGAAMLSDATYLRANLDRAIAALVQDGSIQAILDRHRFPARAGGD